MKIKKNRILNDCGFTMQSYFKYMYFAINTNLTCMERCILVDTSALHRYVGQRREIIEKNSLKMICSKKAK
jgi:hypothetical protein